MAERRSRLRLPGFATIAIAAFVILYLPIFTLVVYSFNARAKAWPSGADFRCTGTGMPGPTSRQGCDPAVADHRVMGIRDLDHGRHDGRAWHHPPPRLQGADVHLCDDQPAADGARDRDRRGAADLFRLVKVATGYQGLGYLIVAHAAFCIPFAYLPIRARLEGMDLSWKPPRPIFTQPLARHSAG
jgi:spermidine/putrescine transport system permease protein